MFFSLNRMFGFFFNMAPLVVDMADKDSTQRDIHLIIPKSSCDFLRCLYFRRLLQQLAKHLCSQATCVKNKNDPGLKKLTFTWNARQEQFLFLEGQRYFVLISCEGSKTKILNEVNKSRRLKMKTSFIISLQINPAAYSIKASPRAEASQNRFFINTHSSELLGGNG